MDALSGSLQHLQHLIDHAAHLLPAQGPIPVFIHHNTLHAFEDLSFEQAVVQAGQVFGCQPFLTEYRYREELARIRLNLGTLLHRRQDWGGAEVVYRESIRLDPEHAEAHCNLAMVLAQQDRLAEAVPMVWRGHELGSGRPGWPYPSEKWLAEMEQGLAEQDARTAPSPREVKRP